LYDAEDTKGVDYEKELGVDEIFNPGTPTDDIVEYIKKNVKRRVTT